MNYSAYLTEAQQELSFLTLVANWKYHLPFLLVLGLVVCDTQYAVSAILLLCHWL